MRNEQEERIRTLKHGEETAHFNMLNLTYDPWGSEEEWKRRYRLHPDFDITENVVIVEKNGQWAGGGTAWFREALLKNNKKIPVYAAGSLYVHPDFRGKGVYSTAMRSLNQLAQKKGAALGFTFPAIYRIVAVALPKYGFVPIFYPTTNVLVLNPDKFFQFLISRAQKTYFPENLNGIKFRLTVSFNTAQDRREISGTFRIENGQIYESRESQDKGHVDLTVKTEIGTLMQIISAFYIGRRALLFRLFSASVMRRLKIRFSMKLFRAFLGF